MKWLVLLFLVSLPKLAFSVELKFDLRLERGVMCSNNNTMYFGRFEPDLHEHGPFLSARERCYKDSLYPISLTQKEVVAETATWLKLKSTNPGRGSRFIGLGYRFAVENGTAQIRWRGGGLSVLYRREF